MANEKTKENPLEPGTWHINQVQLNVYTGTAQTA